MYRYAYAALLSMPDPVGLWRLPLARKASQETTPRNRDGLNWLRHSKRAEAAQGTPMAASERRRQKCFAAIKHDSLGEGREEAATISAGFRAATSTARAAHVAHTGDVLLMHLEKTVLEFLALGKSLLALLGEISLEFLALLGEISLEFLALGKIPLVLLGKMLFIVLLLTPGILENVRGDLLEYLKQHRFICFLHFKSLGSVEVSSGAECGSKLLVRNGEIRLPAK